MTGTDMSAQVCIRMVRKLHVQNLVLVASCAAVEDSLGRQRETDTAAMKVGCLLQSEHVRVLCVLLAR